MLAKHLESCKKVGIANRLKMMNLAVMEELVERVQRNQVEQKPSSDPQWHDDAVEDEVESADESERGCNSVAGAPLIHQQKSKKQAAVTSQSLSQYRAAVVVLQSYFQLMAS